MEKNEKFAHASALEVLHMKQLLCICLATLLLFSLAACGGETIPEPEEDSVYVLAAAYVTDGQSLTAGTVHPAFWRSVQDYCMDNGASCNAYIPDDSSTESLKQSMMEAINDGANAIICPTAAFASAVYELQEEYPQVAFLLVGAVPASRDGTSYWTGENTHCILPHYGDMGYMAGFAAVSDGHRSLAFLGKGESGVNLQYLYGFLQGADDAAEKRKLEQGDVTVRYHILTEEEDPAAVVGKEFAQGESFLFAVGAGVADAVLPVAESQKCSIIALDAEIHTESSALLTSVIFQYDAMVADCLWNLQSNHGLWSADYAGYSPVSGLRAGLVALDQKNWNFQKYTPEEYALSNYYIEKQVITVSTDVSQPPALDYVTYHS